MIYVKFCDYEHYMRVQTCPDHTSVCEFSQFAELFLRSLELYYFQT